MIYDEPFDFENRTITWSETTIYAKWIKEYSITDVEGLSGENENEWTKNSTDGATLTVKFSDENDTSFEEFVGVKLDGTLLEKDKDYTVRKGSTIVTLTPAALQDLAAGEHTITILFNEGVANKTLTILENNAQDSSDNNVETEENKESINNTETIKETKEAATATAEKSPKTGSGTVFFVFLTLISAAGFTATLIIKKNKV